MPPATTFPLSDANHEWFLCAFDPPSETGLVYSRIMGQSADSGS